MGNITVVWLTKNAFCKKTLGVIYNFQPFSKHTKSTLFVNPLPYYKAYLIIACMHAYVYY